MLGSPWELSLLPHVQNLFGESTQQDELISKHYFALAHVYSTENSSWRFLKEVLWVCVSIMDVAT